MSLDNFGNISGDEVPIMNQSSILGLLKVEFSRARRYNLPLTCVLLQVDRYENLRDMYGLKIAESISETMINMINSSTRLSDYLGRIGERLFLIMPHTDSNGGLITARRIMEKLASLDIDINGKLIKVTLSIGLADNKEEDSIFYDSILKNCENSLNQALAQGGDAFVVYKNEKAD